MTQPKAKKPVTIQRLNSWRMHRQHLDKPLNSKSIPDLLKATGWIYSPGCSTPYLSLWARMANFKTEDLNRIVFEDRKLVQMETLRGCTMLVPRDQAAVALRIRSRTFTELAKQARQQITFSDADMEKLKSAILKSLAGGTQPMEELLKAVPRPLVREFEPELKRIGFTNSLSLAVNLLKEEGRIIKIQSRKRLDATEYSYILLSDLLPDVDPFAMRNEEACSRLAKLYFRTEGPARVRDFAWWAGINVTDAMKGVEELKPRLMPLAVEGTKDEYFISEADLEELNSFTPDESAVNFIPYRDTFLKGQREIVDRFLEPEHGDKPFSRWKGKLINDPLATIIHNGRVVGVWEWNEARKDVDIILFASPAKAIEKAIHKRAAELASFIRENLGEIRQGLDYGPHQMTCIHDLKAFWGRGAQVDVRV